MRIKIVGLILTLLFGVIVAYLISMGSGLFLNPAVVTDPALYAARFVQPEIIYEMIQRLGDMLWHYRGIDMVLQAVFLFVAALAASVFFHEVKGEPKDRED